jgi:RNA polymerase sigma factor (sigma-70 family)
MIGIEHPSRRKSVFSDAELARAAQEGDATSLGILLERHRASLYAVALRMLGHGPQAEDAIQDASVIALRSIDRLREPEAVGGWLHGILRNVCLRQLRERRDEIVYDESVAPLEKSASEPPAEEAIDRLAMREWVWSALYELPEALRVTAMLRYFGSFSSYEEISAILEVPVGTVCSRLSQVKVKLAEALLKTAELEHGKAGSSPSPSAPSLPPGPANTTGARAMSCSPAASRKTVRGLTPAGKSFAGSLPSRATWRPG